MPEKASVTPDIFGKFHERMLNRGFVPIQKGEFLTDLKRFELIAPKRIKRQEKGKEVGYRYEANGLVVKVWTTFLPEKGDFRNEDAGWVLITDKNDKAHDFTHDLRRTKYFLRRLYFWAQIAQERVDKRPHCPACGTLMDIGRGTTLKSRIWVCKHREKHPSRRHITLDWFALLSSGALKFLRSEEGLPYSPAVAEKGKSAPGRKAMLKRHAWRNYPREDAQQTGS